MNKNYLLYTLLAFYVHIPAYFSQDNLTVEKLHGLALSKKVPEVLTKLNQFTLKTKKDSTYKSNFEARFKFEEDKNTDFYKEEDSLINPLKKVYATYWRAQLLNPDDDCSKDLKKELVRFFRAENKKHSFYNKRIRKKKLSDIQKAYIDAIGYYSTGFGITNAYYDLIAWKTQKTKTYEAIKLVSDTIQVKVNFMGEFASLGWTEYVTLGYAVPGGWATKEELFCVEDTYDLDSEKFRVNYLKHEGQHFSDYKYYPKLSVRDLEYRAKLIELIFAEDNIYETIEQRINLAAKDSKNPHSFANYCIIRDLSKVIFKSEPEMDLAAWKKIPKDILQEKAQELYNNNTTALNKQASTVINYIQ